MGGGQNFERPNVERPIFRNFEISNTKITRVELFNFSIFEFIFWSYIFLNSTNTQNTYMIIYLIRSCWDFDSFTNFRNWTISYIFGILQFGKLTNLSIFYSTFVNFHIRNVWLSKILLFKIFILIPKVEKLANFPICYNWRIWKMMKYSKLLNFKNYKIFKI